MTGLEQFVGLSGIPLIRASIADLGISSKTLKVVLSLVFGIVINIALSFIFSTNLVYAIAIGFVTGLLSNFYADLKSIGQ